MVEEEKRKEEPMGEAKELSPEEEIEKLKQMLAERDQEIERLETQNFKLRFDELTSLEMRRSYERFAIYFGCG